MTTTLRETERRWNGPATLPHLRPTVGKETNAAINDYRPWWQGAHGGIPGVFPGQSNEPRRLNTPFLDPGLFAGAIAEIVQLGAPHFPMPRHFNLCHVGRV